MSDDDEEVEALVQEILNYLSAHPQAADTVEGISKWWIWKQRVSEKASMVQKAIDKMVVDGLLEARTVAGNKVYSCRPEDTNKK